MSETLTLENLQQQLTEKDNLLSEKENQIAALKDTVAKLQLKLAEKAGETLKQNITPRKVVIPTDKIEVKGKKYAFRVPKFSFNGKLYVSEDVLDDKELITKIIALKGQGILREIV